MFSIQLTAEKQRILYMAVLTVYRLAKRSPDLDKDSPNITSNARLGRKLLENDKVAKLNACDIYRLYRDLKMIDDFERRDDFFSPSLTYVPCVGASYKEFAKHFAEVKTLYQRAWLNGSKELEKL